jgi:tetratricopeptide (TPR) repeat protein
MTKFNFSSAVESIILVLAFLLPIFFFPVTADLFDINKRFLFMFATAILLLLGGVHVIVKREVKLTRSPWTRPLFLFGAATLATILLISPNKIASLLGNGGMYLSFVLFIVAASNLIEKNFTKKLLNALSFSAVAITLTTLFDRFGTSISAILNSAFKLNIPEGTKFFITGSPLFSVFFLGVVGLMLIIRFLQTRGEKQSFTSIVFAAICLVGVLVNGEGLLPGRPTHPQFLSVLDSWSVATDVLKTPMNAVLGVGTDSYANAFSIFRPLRVNQSPIWFVRFNNARNSPLELLATQGILGTATWALVLITSLRLIRTAREEQLALGLGTLAIELLLLFFPPNIMLVSMLAIFIVAWTASLKEKKIHTSETTLSLFALADFSQLSNSTGVNRGQKFVAGGFGVLVSLVALVSLYGLGRAYAAEFFFNRSLVSAAAGNGKDTYDFAVKAIVANPFMENYHRAFAITNLSLAQGLSQKKDLNDTEKQNIITLVQQAIQQAKVATSLDPLNTANWDTLSTIYSALVGSAEGAGEWTIAAFVEQIKTDPANPQPRFTLGTIYRQLGNDDMALQLFQQATQLKPDFANAYFNMADIYKKRGDKANELAMLKATLALITPEQAGYQTVKSRIEELESSQGKTDNKTSVKPAATPSPAPVIDPVALPGDAGLPATNVVPEVPQQ